MKEIDRFLNFLYKNIKDDRITLYKEMNRGHRYYIMIMVLEKEIRTAPSKHTIHNELTVRVDNENNCISLINSYYENQYTTIESQELVTKWSKIFEEYLTKNIEDDVKLLIDNTMKDSKDKDLYREYIMEKIFKEDEPL